MPTKQTSENTQQKPKKQTPKRSESRESSGKDLLNLENKKIKKLSSPKFPTNSKTVDAVTYEVNMTLTVKMGRREILAPKEMLITPSQMIDTENQMFTAGIATIVLVSDDVSLPAERTQGVDAEDVRLLLRLFGLAK